MLYKLEMLFVIRPMEILVGFALMFLLTDPSSAFVASRADFSTEIVASGGEHPDGIWKAAYFCNPGEIATGAEVSWENDNGAFADSSGVGDVRLLCFPSGELLPSDANRNWIDGTQTKACPQGSRVSGFRTKVDDDLGVSNIDLHCQDDSSSSWTGEFSVSANDGTWSTSAFCPTDQFVCGGRIKDEPDQGVLGNNHALTALRLECCTVTCGNSVVDPGETCDDGNTVDGDCCSSTCQVEPAATECRAATNACDIAETCDGVSSVCPSDAFQPGFTECRASAGPCDLGGTCTGVNTICIDQFSIAECRASTGVCDPAESCNGVDAACPADTFANNTVSCDDGTICTSADTCDGAGTCAGGAPLDCDDGNACTAESCDSVTGCYSEPIVGCSSLTLIPEPGFTITWDGNEGDYLGQSVPDNLALSSNGATAYADASAGAPHAIADLNNGVYGNSDSWFTSANPGIAMIAFGTTVTMDRIAFGRDNLAFFTDRWQGTYTLHYTTAVNPNLATPITGDASTGWEKFGDIFYSSSGPGLTFGARRHEFAVASGSGGIVATGLRFEVLGNGPPPGVQIALDEIEVYTTPRVPSVSVLGIFLLCTIFIAAGYRQIRA